MDEHEVLERWKSEVEHGLLIGPSPGKDAENRLKNRLEARMAERQKETMPNNTEGEGSNMNEEKRVMEQPRIVVIGDRLFTDTLLAHQLGLQLQLDEGYGSSSAPNVLSIHTTLLPQPNDVRILRWLEDILSRGKTKANGMNTKEFVFQSSLATSQLHEEEMAEKKGPMTLFPVRQWRGFKKKVEEVHLGWNPQTWKPLALIVGLARGIRWMARWSTQGIKWVWARSRRSSTQLHRATKGS